MTVTCQCGRPVSEAFLCGACTAQLKATLDGIPALVDELDTTITRQAVTGEKGGPRAAEKPLPFNVQASEAAWVLRNTLGGWARVLDAEMPVAGPGRGLEAISSPSGSTRQGSEITTAEIARYLSSRIEQLRHHPAAGEAFDEIRTAVASAQRAIDHPQIRHTFHVGPCPDCDGQLRAYLPADRDQSPYMTCDGETRHTFAAHQWARAGQRIARERTPA